VQSPEFKPQDHKKKKKAKKRLAEWLKWESICVSKYEALSSNPTKKKEKTSRQEGRKEAKGQTRTPYVAQAGLKLKIFLPQPL
jgi:hypothetical protein